MDDIELVIFDCDGVLIDSEIISGRILIELLAAIGIDIDFAYVQRNFLGRSFAKVAAEIREAFGMRLAEDFETRYRTELAAAFRRELKPMPGIEDVLGAMAVRYCMATSSSPARAKMSLELSGLAQHFGDRVFTASQVERGKPAPDLFLFAAARFDVRPARCLVIEDSEPGVRAGLAAGMAVVRFVGGSHMKFAQQSSEPVMAGVRSLHAWSEFFEFAPRLRAGGDVVGVEHVEQG